MKIRVFCGPTLSRVEVETGLPGASVEGPVALGDVLTAVEDGIQCVAIIDGFFDRLQPVWHKEILWALARGVEVYGAASMGALRAAELAPFGMRGIGTIFELLRDGWLERDDEVAVAHATADEGYRALSDALVNMRFTFRLAVRRETVSERFAEFCSALAERTFYAERTYARVLALAAVDPEFAGDAARFRAWLEESREHRVDQKRDDAIELLRVLGERCRRATPEASQRAPFHFSYTSAWNEFRKSHAARRDTGKRNG